MSRKSNADILASYRKRIDYSQKWVEDNNYHQLWNRLINLYRGKQYKGSAEYDRMLVNICFATINVLYPSVSIGRPKIVVTPRTADDADKAIITEAVINYWWEHYDCQEEFQLAVRDFLILGHGWVKSGYRFVEETVRVESTADEMASDEEANTVEAETIIREDRPFIERVDPFMMLVDADSTSMKDMKWIAQCIRRPLNDIKNDKRYDYSARQEVTASSYSKYTNNGNTMKNGSPNPDDAYGMVYEYYDINTNTMSVFADSGDKFLIKPMQIPYAFGQPFTMLRNYDIPNYFYPMGELEAIEPLQYELNETRTQMMNHRKRYSRKYLFKENAFDDFGRQALSSDEDNAMVPVRGDENISNVVQAMPALINPPDFYNQSELIISDIDRVSGISDYQRGVLPEVRRTATEASIVQGNVDSRAAEKLTIIERSIASVANRLIKLAQQFMTEEQTVRVSDKKGAFAWVNFDRDYIDGDFDFMVEAGSTTPMNESFRRQMALQVVDAMAPFAQAGVVSLEKLARYVLEAGFGVKDIESFIQKPGAEQGAQQQAEQGTMPSGMSPEMAGAPMDTAGLPPELAGLPPEVLQQMLAEQGMAPPGASPQGGIAPGALGDPMSIPGAEQLPPEVLASIPPELLDAIAQRGGFTDEVLNILAQQGLI